MDHFQEIFTLPESPVPEYDSRENVLNQIRQMANDVEHVLQWFEEYCEPICNFRATCFKFTKVSQ